MKLVYLMEIYGNWVLGDNFSSSPSVIEKVQPYDVLVITSDGLIEATNPDGEQYGYDRCHEVVKEAAGASRDAEAIKDAMLEDLMDFTETDEFTDDITLFVVKCKPSEGEQDPLSIKKS